VRLDEAVGERAGVDVEVEVEVEVDAVVDVDSEGECEMMEGEGGLAEWDGPGAVGVDDGWSGSPLRIRNAVLSGP
jgi:hypothetical protein